MQKFKDYVNEEIKSLITITKGKDADKRFSKLPKAFSWKEVKGEFFLTCPYEDFSEDKKLITTLAKTEDNKLEWYMTYSGANPTIFVIKGKYKDIAKLVSDSYEYLDIETKVRS
jgi:hypothetical protein